MTNLQNLEIINIDYDLKNGFFWVELEDGRVLQCCLKGGYDGDMFHFEAAIEERNSGYNDGVCWDANEWAEGEDGEVSHINDFLIEQAREIGLEIV